MKNYLVIYSQAEDGTWGAYSPDIEGAYALGATREETEALMHEALAAHIEELRASGLDVPEPSCHPGYIAA